MQPDMQLYEKSSKRGGGIGREHVQPKTLAARHDAVIGSYLEQHSFLWLGRRLSHAGGKRNRGCLYPSGGSKIVAILLGSVRGEPAGEVLDGRANGSAGVSAPADQN